MIATEGVSKDLRGLFSLLGGLGVGVPLVLLAVVTNPPVSRAQAMRLHQLPYAWLNRRNFGVVEGVLGGSFGSLCGYGVGAYLRRRKPPTVMIKGDPQKGIWPPPPTPPNW